MHREIFSCSVLFLLIQKFSSIFSEFMEKTSQYGTDVLAKILEGRIMEIFMTIGWPQISKNSPLIFLANGIFSRPLWLKWPKFRLLGTIVKINLSISRTPGGADCPNQSINHTYFGEFISYFCGEWAGPCLEVKPDVEEDEGDGDEKTGQLEYLQLRIPDADSPRGPSCDHKFRTY
jgi:hypothetical protein